jgi:hypothetical protein
MSTLKVDTLNTVDGTGNITLSRPLSGSGASLTNLPAANLTGALPAISGALLTNLPDAGGPFLGTDHVIRTNANTISENITFAANTNGTSAGPISVASGYNVYMTAGSTWTII